MRQKEITDILRAEIKKIKKRYLYIELEMEQGVKLIAVNCVILLKRAFPSLLDDFFLGGGEGCLLEMRRLLEKGVYLKLYTTPGTNEGEGAFVRFFTVCIVKRYLFNPLEVNDSKI